jgi:hypothetical protein
MGMEHSMGLMDLPYFTKLAVDVALHASTDADKISRRLREPTLGQTRLTLM